MLSAIFFVVIERKFLYNNHTKSGSEKECVSMEKRKKIERQIESLKRVRASLRMNRTEFSNYMQIPLRTLEEWEAGRRLMPDYVLRLIVYYTSMEQRLKEKGIELEDMENE